MLSSNRTYLNLGTAVVAGVYGNQYRVNRSFRTMNSCSDKGYYYECSLRAGTFSIDWFIKKILNIDPSKQPDIYQRLELEARQISAGSDGLLYSSVPVRCYESLLGYSCQGSIYWIVIFPSSWTYVPIYSGRNCIRTIICNQLR